MLVYSLCSMLAACVTVMLVLTIVSFLVGKMVPIKDNYSGTVSSAIDNTTWSNVNARGGALAENTKGNLTLLLFYSRNYRPMMVLIFWGTALLAFASFCSYFHLFTRKLFGYLEQLSKGVDQIAMGDLYKEIPVQGEDEFANIAEKLNYMTEEIRSLIESERTYEQEKNTLITNVAHDLRTPLTSVIGYLDLVQKQSNLSTEDRTKYISIAYDKAIRLMKLIEDLFEFTKVGAELQVHLVEIDFKRFIEQMVEEFYPSFEAAELVCECDLDPQDVIIKADGDLLARCVSNLISNTVKYGKDGKLIRIRLRKNEQKKSVSLEIINFGEIIAPEDISHIFDKFYRGEASRSTKTGGSGLGLAIAKKVVQLHRGQISVSSDYHGTIFKIVLPLTEEDILEEEE